jgi:cytosine/uracil/thiamine/allantoin permease
MHQVLCLVISIIILILAAVAMGASNKLSDNCAGDQNKKDAKMAYNAATGVLVFAIIGVVLCAWKMFTKSSYGSSYAGRFGL